MAMKRTCTQQHKFNSIQELVKFVSNENSYVVILDSGGVTKSNSRTTNIITRLKSSCNYKCGNKIKLGDYVVRNNGTTLHKIVGIAEPVKCLKYSNYKHYKLNDKRASNYEIFGGIKLVSCFTFMLGNKKSQRKHRKSTIEIGQFARSYKLVDLVNLGMAFNEFRNFLNDEFGNKDSI